MNDQLLAGYQPSAMGGKTLVEHGVCYRCKKNSGILIRWEKEYPCDWDIWICPQCNITLWCKAIMKSHANDR